MKNVTAKESNFEKLKPEFLKETGLDWIKHVDLYISYYNAKTMEILTNTICEMNKKK